MEMSQLRAVLFEQNGSTIKITKIMQDGLCVSAGAGANPERVAAWLYDNGFEQKGAFVGEQRHVAVFFVRAVHDYRLPFDAPEMFERILGRKVVPATVRYAFGERAARFGGAGFTTTLSLGEIEHLRWTDRCHGRHRDSYWYIELPSRASA